MSALALTYSQTTAPADSASTPSPDREGNPLASLPTPGPQTSRAQWISLDVAAQRSGLSLGQLRRLCLETWANAGHAQQRRPDGGGKPCWFVSELADARFARVKFPEQLSLEQSKVKAQLTDDQRATIADRRALLQRWEQQVAAGRVMGFSKDRVTATFLDKLLINDNRRLSRATLYNWHAAWRRGGDAALLDDRTAKKKKDLSADCPFVALVERLYLTPRKRPLQWCVDFAEQQLKDAGEELPSTTPAGLYKLAQRHIDKLPRQLLIKTRDGEDAFVAQCEPAIERDYTSLASNDWWCADDHCFDVMVMHEGKPVRPWITGFQDLRSRRIVGYVIGVDDPNSEIVLRAFAQGVRACGRPNIVLIDNGKHYDSRAVQGVSKRERRAGTAPGRLFGAFNTLGVEVKHATPYHGQAKPIERTFGTICSRFARMFDSYWGNASHHRPEDAQIHVDAGRAPTLEEFRECFSLWLDQDYHNAGHSGHGMNGATPMAVYQAALSSVRPIAEEELAIAVMPKIGPLKINKQGVTWQGLHYGAFSGEVQARYGQEVIVAIDPDDVRSVYLLDLQGRMICRAPANGRMAFDADASTVREAIREKKQLRKRLKDYIDHRPHMSQDVAGLVNRAALRRQLAGEQPATPEPPSMRLVQTPFAGQLEEIRNTLDTPMRLAISSAEVEPIDDAPVSFRELMEHRARQEDDQ